MGIIVAAVRNSAGWPAGAQAAVRGGVVMVRAMEWIMTFVGWLVGLFRWRRKAAPAPAAAAAPGVEGPGESGDSVAGAEAPAPEEKLYAHAPDKGVSRGLQHHWLVDEGVLHWNQRRREEDFRPDFAGYDFVAQGKQTRLWGQPADLDGGARLILAGVDFRFARLAKAVLAGADLRRAHLQGADLRGANLAGANLEGADLTDCDLREAVLEGADFSRARLVNANLSGARMAGANLAWADITHMAGDAALEGVNLFGVRRG